MRICVRLVLTLTSAGGRQHPIASGYRATWDIGDRLDDGRVHHHDAWVQSLTVASLAPGDAADAVIEPSFPGFWARIRPGDRLAMCEGLRIVGAATVLSIDVDV